jgi:two-component system chemotaxis family response regulator WspR
VVILPGTPLAPLQPLANKLCRNVEALHIPHSGSTTGEHLTISVGGATSIPQQEDSFLHLVEIADAGLYEAKESGKNRAVTREHNRASQS